MNYTPIHPLDTYPCTGYECYDRGNYGVKCTECNFYIQNKNEEVQAGAGTSDSKSGLEIFQPIYTMCGISVEEAGIAMKQLSERLSQFVTISKEEYKKLLISELKLDALESSGVDNWEWYGDSFNEEYYEELDRINKI